MLFKTNAEKVAVEARRLIDALFEEQKVKTAERVEAEEPKKQHLVFELEKDGVFNYDFITADRISGATRESYVEVLQRVMSFCPDISEDNVKTILNVFANHLDISERLFAASYGTTVATHMTQVCNGLTYNYMLDTARIFNDPFAFESAMEQIDGLISNMRASDNAQEKLTAIGLSMLEGEVKIFGFLMNSYCQKQYDYLMTNFAFKAAENHMKILVQLNRLSRIITEVVCTLYQKIGNK